MLLNGQSTHVLSAIATRTMLLLLGITKKSIRNEVSDWQRMPTDWNSKLVLFSIGKLINFCQTKGLAFVFEADTFF